MTDSTKESEALTERARVYCDQYYNNPANFLIESDLGSVSPAMRHYIAGFRAAEQEQAQRIAELERYLERMRGLNEELITYSENLERIVMESKFPQLVNDVISRARELMMESGKV